MLYIDFLVGRNTTIGYLCKMGRHASGGCVEKLLEGVPFSFESLLYFLMSHYRFRNSVIAVLHFLVIYHVPSDL